MAQSRPLPPGDFVRSRADAFFEKMKELFDSYKTCGGLRVPKIRIPTDSGHGRPPGAVLPFDFAEATACG